MVAPNLAEQAARTARIEESYERVFAKNDARRAAIVAERRAVVMSLANVEPEPISWLWEGWLARRKLTLLGGHPGDGKSTLTLSLAAAGSVGGKAPDGSPLPTFNTLLVLAEDDLADTVRPRLDIHKADVTRIFTIKHIENADGKRQFLNLQAHCDELRVAIREHDISLLVIDPISSYLQKSDRNNEGDVRDALQALMDLITETNVAALAVMHVGKGVQGRTPQQMLLGSTGFVGLARFVWMTAKLPVNEQSEGMPVRMALGIVKSNSSVPGPPLVWSRVLDGPVVFHGETTRSMEELLTSAYGSPKPNKLEMASNFLREFLAGGSRSFDEIRSAAGAAHAAGTLRDALHSIGAEKYQLPGKASGGWFWRLPR